MEVPSSDIYVENIKLDKSNTIFFNASKLVLETETPLIYLTGKAGTGKTTFLKYIHSCYNKNLVILAPTGLAAVNAGGQTIHSFFKLQFTPYLPNDKRWDNKNQIYDTFKHRKETIDIIKNLSLIIIDEISMVRCDILDIVNRILCSYRETNKPFGGIRLLLVGDTFQLPPIVKSDEWNILKQFYTSPYFFNSKIYEACNPVPYIELKNQYRQSEEEFLYLLNSIRVNQITENILQRLNERVISPTLSKEQEEPILLAPINYTVNKHNESKFCQLATEIKIFSASIQGDYPPSLYPVEKDLRLRVGAQVMITKNNWDSQSKVFNYYNGNIGIVRSLKNDYIEIELKDKSVKVEKAIWENSEFRLVENENPKEERYISSQKKKHLVVERVIKGTFSQFPIKLAWAITINKSQGLTFDSINADLSNCFDYGQVYVALSRCRYLNGVYLQSPITRNAIKTDPRVLAFAKTESPESLIVEKIERDKADKLYKQSREEIEQGDIIKAIETLNNAIKIRDDRNTPKFKKYFSILINLFNHYRTQRIQFYNEKKQIKIELEKITKEQEELENNLNSQNKKFSNQIIVLENQRDFLNEQLKRENEKSEVKYQEIIDLKTELQAKILAYEHQQKELEQKITILNMNIDSRNKHINELEANNELLKIEIARLNQITWWQKLRGKK